MLARMALSEKLKEPIVRLPFFADVAFLAPPPDEPQAPATRARTTAAAPTTRARCNRMGFPLSCRWLSDVSRSSDLSGSLDCCGRPHEGLILAAMAMGEATRHHTTLHEGQGHLGEDRQRGDQHGAGEHLHVVALGQPVDDV